MQIHVCTLTCRITTDIIPHVYMQFCFLLSLSLDFTRFNIQKEIELHIYIAEGKSHAVAIQKKINQ